MASGDVVNGKITGILNSQVTVENGAGEKVSHSLADFDAATQEAIDAWAKKHPLLVDVYTKFDKQPVIKSSSKPLLPDEFRKSSFKGMVSIDLVLDLNGKVISAKVQKSTHPELEAPTIKAAKSWRFEPAKVGGKAVKAKLRVPFKFSTEI